MFKSIALASALLVSAVSFEARACSVSVNNNFMKDSMILAAVTEYGIHLDGATLAANGYSKTFVGSVRGTGCPAKVRTKANVHIDYRLDNGASCTLTVQVTRLSAIGGLALANFSFASPASSCVL